MPLSLFLTLWHGYCIYRDVTNKKDKIMTEREYQSPEDKILLENRILDAIPTGSEFDGCLNIAERIEAATGHKAVCYDQYIDDGCGEDEEDTYVMCAAFNVEDTDMTVRVYYGDATEIIGYVEVDW